MVLNSLDYLKKRTINGEDYVFANTFIKIDSEFYRKDIFPLNLALVIILGFVIPLILCLILIKA